MFSASGLESLLTKSGIEASTLEAGLTDGREKRFSCPDCRISMMGVEIRGEILDVCPTCRCAFVPERSLHSFAGETLQDLSTKSGCCRHPSVEPDYRCEHCRELLCVDCVEPGFEVFFCKVCGGDAIAFHDAAPALPTVSSPDERYGIHSNRDVGRSRPIDMVLYPFRGLGGYLFAGYLFTMAIGYFFWPLRFLIALLIPAFMFKIVRQTVQGNDELPDWPEFDAWNLVRDTITFWLLTLASISPALVVGMELPWDQGLVGLVLGLPFLLIAFLVGFIFWIPAFGAVAVYENAWLIPRVDRHIMALRSAGRDTLLFAGLLALLFVFRVVLQMALVFVPYLGWILATILELYSTVMAAHLVGLLFRRHVEKMDEAYMR